jgi:hypothetical protein
MSKQVVILVVVGRHVKIKYQQYQKYQKYQKYQNECSQSVVQACVFMIGNSGITCTTNLYTPTQRPRTCEINKELVTAKQKAYRPHWGVTQSENR